MNILEIMQGLAERVARRALTLLDKQRSRSAIESLPGPREQLDVNTENRDPDCE